jgi:hypothetical protein
MQREYKQREISKDISAKACWIISVSIDLSGGK